MSDAPDWLWFDGEDVRKVTFGRWAKHDGQVKYVRADRIEALEAENARLREALEWYEAVVERCNSFAPEGDIARDMLAKDVGKKARAALKGDT